jgi:hypothetical protein
MIGCWVAQWVWWVGLHPAGWRLVSSLFSFLYPDPGIDDEPGKECFFMKGDIEAKLIVLCYFFRYCPPRLREITMIWVVFSAIGEFGSRQVPFLEEY